MATLDSDDLTAIENLINASVDGVLAKLPGSGRAATLAEIWPNGVRDLNDYGALLVAIGLLFDDLVDTDLTDLLQEIQGLLEDGVTLQTSEENALIAAIDAALLNDGDATDFIAGLLSRLGNENVDAVVLAGALKAALFHADDVGNKLRVSTAGEVSVVGDGGGAHRVTVSATYDGDAVPGVKFAIVGTTLSRTTGASGEVFFDVDDDTYTLRTTVPFGYEDVADVEFEVDGDDLTLDAIELVRTVITPPDNPAFANLIGQTIDETGNVESGVVVYCKIVTVPTSPVGNLYDGATQTATSDGGGVVAMVVPKGSVVEVKRGEWKSWKRETIGSGDEQYMTAMLGVDE